MVEARLITGFWRVVEDCLVQFHDNSREQASTMVADLQTRLGRARTDPRALGLAAESAPPSLDPIYHEEPWYIASNLANSTASLRDYWEPYQEILARYGLVSAPQSIR